ncbi:MAG: metalloprotease TldD [Pseudomonadota bacterium]
MSNTFEFVSERLLAPSGLTESHLHATLGQLMTHGVDASDLYFQAKQNESWVLEDGLIKEGGFSIDQGVGVRAVSGEKTGFAYSDEILLTALEEAAASARAISRAGQSGRVQAWHRPVARELYGIESPLSSLDEPAKLDLLRRIDAAARDQDPRVSQVIASVAASHEYVLVASSDGTVAADIRPMVRLNATVYVESNGRRETANAGCGGRYSLSQWAVGNEPEHLAGEAVRQALVNLEAVDAPAGEMVVVLGNGWPGVLLHEAVGHGLEGDFSRKGTSVFSGRVGEQVASKGVTVVDDGTLDGHRGSLNIDDEGVPSQCNTLIEDGKLVGFMQDKHNAALNGVPPTGNGRRQSYAHTVMPRMTNTYMRAGPHAPEEILASVKKGLYAVNFGGGQVDITSGKFVFSASEAYLVENGKLGAPVKGATLVGNGPDVMTRVGMVGNDLALDRGVGTCGKQGQSVPVCVGQPTLRVDGLTVGGTATA